MGAKSKMGFHTMPRDRARAFSRRGTRRLVRALDKRLRNIKPDCPACGGTGFARVNIYGPCGLKENSVPLSIPCDCSNPIGPAPPRRPHVTRT
jgi:hypothetical protein